MINYILYVDSRDPRPCSQGIGKGTTTDYLCNSALMATSLAQSLPTVNIFNLTPSLPNLRCIPHRRQLSISNNRSLYHLLICQKFLFPLILRNIFHKCQCILILAIFIYQCIDTTNCLAYTAEFSFTDFLFAHIDELKLNATFFKVTLGFLCVVALFRIKYLYIHSFPLSYSIATIRRNRECKINCVSSKKAFI